MIGIITQGYGALTLVVQGYDGVGVVPPPPPAPVPTTRIASTGLQERSGTEGGYLVAPQWWGPVVARWQDPGPSIDPIDNYLDALRQEAEWRKKKEEKEMEELLLLLP